MKGLGKTLMFFDTHFSNDRIEIGCTNPWVTFNELKECVKPVIGTPIDCITLLFFIALAPEEDIP